jgi:hypothetical protein
MDNYQAFQSEHYIHSGKFGLLLFLLIPINIVIVFLLAFVYNYAVIYIPFVGYLSIILTFGYALGIGYSLAFSIHISKTRNNVVARLLGLFIAALAVYIAWAAFLYVFINKNAPAMNIPFINILISPQAMWKMTCGLAETGWYSLRSFTPKGWILWTMWGIEALIIAGCIYFLSDSLVKSAVFCERCNKWTEEKKNLVVFLLEDASNLVDQFVNKDFSFIPQAIPAKSTAPVFFRIDSSVCHDCKDLHTLSLLEVNKSYNDKGEESLEEEPLVQNLILAPEEYDNLINMKKQMLQGKLQTAKDTADQLEFADTEIQTLEE